MRTLFAPARWLFLAALAAVLAAPAAAADHGGHHRGGGPHPGGHAPRPYAGRSFYGRDFHHFRPHELTYWRRGHWVHGWHDGRHGWWWSLGGYWYLYPEPIYPYPTYVPPAVVVQQAPPQPSGLPPAQYWYFCDDPQGYYPYVASCNGPWRPVPVTPPAP